MRTRFSARPDWSWGPPSLLYNGYRVFPGGKVRPQRAADHSPPSSAAVTEEYSYTSTQSLGHTGTVTGSLYLYLYYLCLRKFKILSYSLHSFTFFGSIFCHCINGCVFCLLFNSVNYVFLLCYVYVYVLLCLSILISIYVPFWVFCFIVSFCAFFCVQVYTVLLSPDVNPIAVNKYII